MADLNSGRYFQSPFHGYCSRFFLQLLHVLQGSVVCFDDLTDGASSLSSINTGSG
jgi:hypothetical protein